MMRTEYDLAGMISATLILVFFLLLLLFCRAVETTHASHETGAETEAKACNKKRGMCN